MPQKGTVLEGVRSSAPLGTLIDRLSSCPNRLETDMKLTYIAAALLVSATHTFAQTSGGGGSAGGSSSSGTTGPSRSGSTPSAASPSRAGPNSPGTINNRAVAPNAVPSPGNSAVPSQSSGTSPDSTPGTPRSGQGVNETNPANSTGNATTTGQDANAVDPNFRGSGATPTTQDGKVQPTQPSTGGIQSMGEKSSTTDTGAYGKSVDDCMSAFDAANHMSKEEWRKTCERTTTR